MKYRKKNEFRGVKIDHCRRQVVIYPRSNCLSLIVLDISDENPFYYNTCLSWWYGLLAEINPSVKLEVECESKLGNPVCMFCVKNFFAVVDNGFRGKRYIQQRSVNIILIVI